MTGGIEQHHVSFWRRLKFRTHRAKAQRFDHRFF
jgi:hypothetical protein